MRILLLTTCLLTAFAQAAGNRPAANLSRGIYAPAGEAMPSMVWAPWGDGATYDVTTAHGGKRCLKAVCDDGGKGQGLGQTVALDQPAAKPIRISGWSKAEDVVGPKSYKYSLYVDLTYADGESWPMQLAAFETGTHDWQLSEVVVTPAKPVKSARFYAFIRQTTGTVWFDDLFFGEEGGENLLQNPGFEGAAVETGVRTAFYDILADLHCNGLHTYLGSSASAWETPDDPDNELREMLDYAHQRGVGVWLTLGTGFPGIKSADDPNFPQYQCVNGPWGERWTAAVGKAAKFPFAGLSMVPDEYNDNTGRLVQAFAKHRDPKVAEFYQDLGTYCSCPVCQAKFKAAYGLELPDVSRSPQESSVAYRDWLEFRYDSTTAWIGRSVQAVKQADPGILTDSLICVTPLCSDNWFGPGVAWDRLGYEAGLDRATTDPYIELHNYLGDSNHWYVTETTEHLAAASPERGCGIVLEASRLRQEYRELDPPEVYGSALSAVWHGANELAWWHYSHLTDRSHTTDRASQSYAWVKGCYGLLEQIDRWFTDSKPWPGIAFLFSRASCDAWRLYASDPDRPQGILTHDNEDARYASVAQKELLNYLFRQGFPTTLYYLDSVKQVELDRYPVVVVPFPYALSDDRAELLEALAKAGKTVIVVSEVGTLDAHYDRRAKPALLDLLGLKSAPSAEAGEHPTQYVGLDVTRRKVGRGQVIYLPGEYGHDLVLNRDNEVRSREVRIMPGPLDSAVVAVWRGLLDKLVGEPLLTWAPDGDDLELALRQGQGGAPLLLAINWSDQAKDVKLPARPLLGEPIEAYQLTDDGKFAPAKVTGPTLRLLGNAALVARYSR